MQLNGGGLKNQRRHTAIRNGWRAHWPGNACGKESRLGLLDHVVLDASRTHASPYRATILTDTYILQISLKPALADTGDVQAYSALLLCQTVPNDNTAGPATFAAYVTDFCHDVSPFEARSIAI